MTAPDHQIKPLPEYRSEFSFGGCWLFCFRTSAPMPSRFHRAMQRWLLGVHWREVEKPHDRA